jgi:very-short-patch-repair endonuclease
MPRFRISPEQRSFAKEQRRLSTRAEAALWHVLRAGRLGFTFKRQVPIGAYTVDFICLEKRLIVELDGSPHEMLG